jgi:hypothetical protein
VFTNERRLAGDDALAFLHELRNALLQMARAELTDAIHVAMHGLQLGEEAQRLSG